MTKMVHLNNAGASLVSDTTLDKMIGYLKLEQSMGGYEAAARQSQNLEEFYAVVGDLIDGDKDNIAFTDSATRAWNTILFSLKIEAGDKILTTSMEYGSNVVSLQSLAERNDAELVVLKVGSDGFIDIDELRNHLDERVKLVAVTHAPAHCGTVLNASEIGKCVADFPAYYLVDACQTLGQFDVKISDLRCDALVGTGRKWLRGPRGTGFVYASEAMTSALNSVSIDLANTDWLPHAKNGSHIAFLSGAKRLENWERSLAGQLGLTNAIKEFGDQNKNSAVHTKIQTLRAQVSDAIGENKNLVLYPDRNRHSGVVTFYCKNKDASDVKMAFARHNINVSLIGRWAAPWDFEEKNLPTLVRVSPHAINSVEDIGLFSKVVETL